MKFWLGTHIPSWLGRADVAVPLFISHVRLRDYKTLPRAVAPWALDSGAFSEVGARGADAFSAGPKPYIQSVRRYRDEIGKLAWAAPQDWMCEPFMTTRTGFTVIEHQKRTIENLLDLRSIAPDLPFIPVLQGYTPDDYLRCVDLYAAAGVDLTAEPLVGLGSICRRNRTNEIVELVSTLARADIAIHGFGSKGDGAVAIALHAASVDSMAWSFWARYEPALPSCRHKSCQNCHHYALAWRERLLARIAQKRMVG